MQLYAQTSITKDVPITLEISNTAINRVIAHQWSSLPNQNFSGNYNGLTYSITLNRPSISLEPNKIVSQLSLSIASSANGQPVYNGTLIVNPEVVIPANTINLGNIVTNYVNLRQSIDQLTVLVSLNDSRLNQVIENILSPIDWIMYTGNAIEQSQVRWTDGADIRWNDLPDISYSINNGKIVINVLPKIKSQSPFYTFKMYKQGEFYQFEILSNVSVEILSVKVFKKPNLSVKQLIFQRNESEINTTNVQLNESNYRSLTQTFEVSNIANQAFIYQIRFIRLNFESTYEVYTGLLGTNASSTRDQDSEYVTIMYGE